MMIDSMPFKITDLPTIEAVYRNKFYLEPVIKKEIPATDNRKRRFVEEFKYKNLRFSFLINHEGVLIDLVVRGSMHYLYNEGIHNYDHFGFLEFKETWQTFSDKFNIDPRFCILLPPEFGVNIYLSDLDFLPQGFSAANLVDSTLYECRKKFSHNPSHIMTSVRSGSPNHEYRLKVYSKTDEFKNVCLQEQVCRFETHLNKTRHLKKMGIVTVADLLKIENQILLMNKHLDYFRRVVMFDSSISLPRNHKDYRKLEKYSNPNYWRDLVAECRRNQKNNKRYNYEVNKLNKLSNKYGCGLHKNILESIERQYRINLGLSQGI